MKIVAIYRASCFSPNSVERDKTILDAVGRQLIMDKHSVAFIHEDEISEKVFQGVDAVFSMAREEANLRQMVTWIKQCPYVFNNPEILLQSSRTQLTQLMAKRKIPQPKYELLKASQVHLKYPFWLKRGDLCAQESSDVCFIENNEILRIALSTFSERGIKEILAFEHEEGDLVKFYGVAGTDFFRICYPQEGEQFSKFGLETHNTMMKRYVFDTNALYIEVSKLSKSSGIIIYGGDAIIRSDGSFSIIDFNDWPSFSTFREEASQAIASLIH